MNILEIIDAMSWKEFLIFLAVFLGIVNLIAWAMLYKAEQSRKNLNQSAKKLIDSIVNESQPLQARNEKMKFNIKNEQGFVDGGVIIALVGVAMVALVASQESISKQSIVNKEEIKVADTVYKCHPIRKKVIQYYDLVEKKTKPIEVKKECEK